MSIIRGLFGSTSNATLDTASQAQTVTGTDRLAGIQPSNSGAPNTLVEVSPDQLAAYGGLHPPFTATVTPSSNPLILDQSLQGRTVVVTAALTIEPPSTWANLGGGNSGDGFWCRFINPNGYTVTFAGNGGNTISGLAGVTSTTLASFGFRGSYQGGVSAVTIELPSVAAPITATGATTPVTAPSTGNVGVAITGLTTTLTPSGATAYANLVIAGTEQSGGRKSFTGTTAIPSLTPGTTGTATVNIYAAATGGTALATSANITINAAAATAYTTALSASSGSVGSAVTMTFTPTGTWPSTETITPTVSGISGTFSPTTVSPTAGSSTAATCTFTPSAAASGTLNSSASPSMTNTTGALAYTANAASPFAVTSVLPQAIGAVSTAQTFNVSYTGTWAVPTVTVDGTSVTPSANSAGSGGVGTITIASGNVGAVGMHTLAVTGTSGSAQSTLYWNNSTATNPYSAEYNTYYPNRSGASPAGEGALTMFFNAYGGNNGVVQASGTHAYGDANNVTVSTLATVVQGWTTNPSVPPFLTWPVGGYSNRTSVSNGGNNYYNGCGNINAPGTYYNSYLITDAGGAQYLLVDPVAGTYT